MGPEPTGAAPRVGVCGGREGEVGVCQCGDQPEQRARSRTGWADRGAPGRGCHSRSRGLQRDLWGGAGPPQADLVTAPCLGLPSCSPAACPGDAGSRHGQGPRGQEGHAPGTWQPTRLRGRALTARLRAPPGPPTQTRADGLVLPQRPSPGHPCSYVPHCWQAPVPWQRVRAGARATLENRRQITGCLCPRERLFATCHRALSHPHCWVGASGGRPWAWGTPIL